MLRQLGIEHPVVRRGVPSEIDRTGFRWTAADGSTVRAEYLPAGYGNGARVPHEPNALIARIDEFAHQHATKLAGGPVLWMNGTDHLLPQRWLAEVVAKANAAQDRSRSRHWPTTSRRHRVATTTLPGGRASFDRVPSPTC